MRNLKSWKNKLEEVLTTWERSLVLEAFLHCMIVKAPLFWALLLLCELKCWILVCAPPMRGKALQKLEEGYMKFSGNVFLFFFEYSANFLIKDKNLVRDVLQEHVLK